MKKSYLFLFALAWIAGPDKVQAQDATYTPPPMFEDPTPPMVRPETNTGNIVEPKVSPREGAADYVPQGLPSFQAPAIPATPETPAAPVAPAIVAPTPRMMLPIMDGDPATTSQSSAAKPYKPKAKSPVKPDAVSTKAPAPKAAKPTPPPPAKPVPPAPPVQKTEPALPEAISAPPAPTPVKEEAPIIIEPAKPEPVLLPEIAVPAPPQQEAPVPVPVSPPAAKVTNEGVVKGPKTMPAVPTQTVVEEPTFQDLTAPLHPEKTILQLHQERLEHEQHKDDKKSKGSDTLVPVVPPSAEAAIPFDEGNPGVLKKILPYQPGQITLAEGDLVAIATGVSTELSSKSSWRVLIRSFATPAGDGLSSDRRIALSRVLALRKALLDQGIEPSRIDVQSDGVQTSAAKSGDRIDLYLYDPLKK